MHRLLKAATHVVVPSDHTFLCASVLISKVCMPVQQAIPAQDGKLPVHVLADMYGLSLPTRLPPSLSARAWVMRRIATINGRHRRAWQVTRSDPDKLAAHREGSRLRMRKCRLSMRDFAEPPTAAGDLCDDAFKAS